VLPAAVKPGTDLPAAPVTGSDRMAFLADGIAGASAVFARPAPVPAMPWIDAPDTGLIAGLLRSSDPGGNDTVEVLIKRKRLWPFGNTTHIRTDANGFFGLARVKPGRYEIAIGNSRRYVHVAAGIVSRVPFP
jgi:hypothetical protein